MYRELFSGCGVVLGKRGSGKTTLALALSHFHRNVVALDVVGDLPGDWQELREVGDVKRLVCGGRWRLRVPEWVAFGWKPEAIMRLIVRSLMEFSRGRLLRHGACLFLDEVDFWGGAWNGDPHLLQLIKIGRHFRLLYICTSRRYAEIPKALTANADYIAVGPSLDPVDKKVMRAMGLPGNYTLPEYTFFMKSLASLSRIGYVAGEDVIDVEIL